MYSSSWQMYCIVCKYITRCSEWEKALWWAEKQWIRGDGVLPCEEGHGLEHTDCEKQRYPRESLWSGGNALMGSCVTAMESSWGFLLVGALCSWLFSLEMGRAAVKLQWNHHGDGTASHASPAIFGSLFRSISVTTVLFCHLCSSKCVCLTWEGNG